MAAGRKLRNPFRGVSDIISEMNRMSDLMGGIDSGGSNIEQRPRGFADAWSPTTDIFAQGSDLVIRTELAGVAADDVEVTLSHGTLTIFGDRRVGAEQDNDFYVRERYSGQFRRDITLPPGVEDDDIDAQLREGVLQVTVRNASDAGGPAKIEVRK
ncbi:MAG: Hsp20 family protein [Pseudonocardiaceae bacterium]|nr:Hsp20 family protein [Pseudonocardiaceae bacterium]